MKAGDRVLLDDGLIGLKVQSIKGREIHCLVEWGGHISDHKGINLPDTRFSMPYVSASDYEDILFGIRTGFDVIAASFVRTREDVLEIRRILKENGGEHIRILAKIENAEGVEHVTDVLIDHAVDAAKQAGLVKNGDLVVLTAGVPLGRSGTTNLIKVHRVE